MSTRGNVVDLFCGAGGASIGFENAGFDVVAAVDIDEHAVETYENNLSLEPWPKDLTKVTFREILAHFDLEADEVDVVAGCPPCQNFSTLRDTDPWPEGEPKDELLRTYVDLIEEARPKVVAFENVQGILSTDGGAYVEYLRRRMDELGYGFKLEVMNAANFGVPQRRKRTIGFGIHGVPKEDVEMPEPTHGPSEKAKENGVEPWNTVEDQIHPREGFKRLERGEKDPDDPEHRARRHQDSTMEIIRAVPKDGGSRTEIEDESLILDCHKDLGKRSTASNVYGRMSWKDPAPTLTTRCTTPSCGRYLHPEQDRAITFREAAELMTFPDGFKLPKYNDHAERVVGNAVPPEFIEELVDQFFALNSSVIY